MYLSIPLRISDRRLQTEADTTQSIRQFLDMLAASAQGSFAADPEFGFVLKNFRFQNFNEDKGVLYSAKDKHGHPIESSVYYRHKVHGKSRTSNTFAMDFRDAVQRYEPRLRQVNVDMDYARQQKTITLTITGKTGPNFNDPFDHKITFHVW